MITKRYFEGVRGMKEKSIYKMNGFIGVIMILVLLVGVLFAIRSAIINESRFQSF